MRYCHFTVYNNLSTPRGAPYEFDIWSDRRLYSWVPHDSSRYLLKEGSSAGYDNFESMKEEIIGKDGLNFNPFRIREYIGNQPANEDSYITNLIKTFGGKYKQVDFHAAYVLPDPKITPPPHNQTLMGYNTLEYNYPARMTCGFWGGGATLAQDSLHNDSIFRRTDLVTHAEYVEYHFGIWPEEFIIHDRFDFTKLDEGTEFGKRLCNVILTIWQDVEDTGKFYYKIEIVGYDFRTDEDPTDWETALAGKDPGHIYNTKNPYDTTSPEDNDGGQGDYDDDLDSIIAPGAPDVDITDSGAVVVFKLTPAQVGNIFAFLGSKTPLDSFIKWWGSPLNSIVSLHVLPFDVHIKGAAEFKCGGLTTGITAPTCAQWEVLNMGSIYTPEYWGNALDYAPYTKCSIYLPMVGVRDLNADDVIKHTLSLQYNVDIISGQCIVFITVTDSSGRSSVKYSFTGNAAESVPLSQESWGQTYIAAASIAASAISSGITAGAAALAGGEGAGAAAGAGIMGAVRNGIGNASTSLAKPSVTRSGAISGAAGLMSVRQPYLIIERPVDCIPSYMQSVEGYPSGKGVTMATLSGFNSIESCRLENIHATQEELEEIERLLGQGAIF